MVQKIASLIDETLMAMNAHLHVQMTHEEKAYLDAHFELIHIKKGEYLMNRGDEVPLLSGSRYYPAIVPRQRKKRNFGTVYRTERVY